MTNPTHTITVAQAAETLGVSERTVWRYLKSGRLPGETTGEPGSQRTLIPREAVEALTSTRVGVDAEALRAERDRLVAELAAACAERDALTSRVSVLQRSLSDPLRPGIAERALGRAMGVVARARGPRTFSLR
jgi:excisionase family DNA binding protein